MVCFEKSPCRRVRRPPHALQPFLQSGVRGRNIRLLCNRRLLRVVLDGHRTTGSYPDRTFVVAIGSVQRSLGCGVSALLAGLFPDEGDSEREVRDDEDEQHRVLVGDAERPRRV